MALATTDRAIRAIRNGKSEALAEWMGKKLANLCHDADFANVAAALGEIRAGGLLADAQYNVEHVPEGKGKTPDFQIGFEEGPVYIEVYTHNMPTDQAKAIQDFEQGPPPKVGPNGVGVKELVVYPMGEPKDGETTVENVASKIAGKKPRAEQVSKEFPAIMWLDLQDEDAWSIGNKDVELAWVGNDGEFFTTGLWHAFYGEKGTPMLEAQTVQRRQEDRRFRQSFNGTFRQHATWSAVVLSLASATVILENPFAARKLPGEFFTLAPNLFRFNFALSWMDWPPGVRSLSDRVADACQTLHSLAEVARYSW